MFTLRNSALRRIPAVAAAGALLLPAAPVPLVPSGPPAPVPNRLRPVHAQRPVRVHRVPSSGIRPPSVRLWHQPKLAWPAPGLAVTSAAAGAAGTGGTGR